MDFYPYEFSAPIEKYDFGRMAYTIVYLPDELARQLPLKEFPKLRVDADMSGVQISAALMPVRGRWYMMFNAKNMARTGKSLGDEITVRFGIADQDAIDIPLELEDALSEDSFAKSVWDGWTVGKKRGAAYRIASAKTSATRDKRVAELLGILLDG